MFGEELIIGHAEGKMDGKGRIHIPSFTFVEPNERLIIESTNFENEKALIIYSYNEYIKIINRLRKLRGNSTSMAEHNLYTSIINKMSYNLLALIKTDAQKRVLISSYSRSELNLNTNDILKLDGFGESLLIRKKPSK